MPGRRLWYLVALAGCLAFYFCYQKWLSWIFLVCTLALPWFSLLVSLPGILTFRPKIQCPDRVTVGEQTEIRLVGGSRCPVPPFRGRLRVNRRPLGESRLHRGRVALDTTHCGSVTVESEKVAVLDYLGLFRFRAKPAKLRTVWIWPVPMKMSGVPDLDQLLSRAWRPKPGGGFSENHELRLYRPGDSLNQIHWKLTAKTGNPIIREPMIPQRMRILVTVDVSGTPEELDRKCGRLLWLMGHLLEKGVSFEIQAFTGEGMKEFYVSGEREAQGALQSLLQSPAAGEGSMLDQTLHASWHCHVGGEPDEA